MTRAALCRKGERASHPSMEAFGKYRVIAPLANGGMAQVDLVENVGLRGFSKVMVLKRMYPHTAGDRTLRDMFLDEARVAARLDHPNIATVFELGEHDGTYFIVMEYLQGDDLGSVLRQCRRQRRDVPVPLALHVALGCALGLHHAHELRGPDGRPTGLVHRDVNPANVMMTFHGQVKLLDFGIAKIQAGTHETRAGTFKGKLSHASPEQISGAPVDRRTDVFQLGILLWELLACERLFAGTSEAMIVDKIKSAPIPPPSAHRAEVSPALDAVVLRALARAPADRYPTARHLADALVACQHQLGGAMSALDAGAWLGDLVGPELVALELDIAQGRDLERSAARLAELFDARTTPIPVTITDAGDDPRPRPRAAWSHDLAGGDGVPSARSTADVLLRAALPHGLEPPPAPPGADAGPPARTPPPAPPARVPPPESAFVTTSLSTEGPVARPPRAAAPARRPVVVLAVLGTLLLGAGLAASLYTGAPATTPSVARDTRTLHVSSTPAGAAVLIDGEPTGRTTPASLEDLPVDRALDVRVELRGFAPSKTTLAAGIRGAQTYNTTLVPALSAVAFRGQPPGARLYVDGREISATREVELTRGPHELRVERGDELLHRRTFEVTEDRQIVDVGDRP